MKIIGLILLAIGIIGIILTVMMPVLFGYGGLIAGVTAILTGIGLFDRIARYAGAGTLVPITGFANAVVSPAIDSRAEGLILGVGAKIFNVAGPVLLYGTLAGTAWGVIYYVISLFK